jgi:hypothetical protein
VVWLDRAGVVDTPVRIVDVALKPVDRHLGASGEVVFTLRIRPF